jgi:glutamate carboxypeptidase
VSGRPLGLPREEASEIRSYLEDHSREMVDYLVELVRRESPSDEPAAQEPVFELLRRELEGAGYRVRRKTGRRTGGLLFALPAGRERGRPVQLLLGHVDTVWDEGTIERMPPRTEEGRLRGPGVFDMKGGLAQMVFALRAIHELGLRPQVDPAILITSDEEVGSPESERWIHALARISCRAYVLEPALGLDGKLKTARRGTGHLEVRIRGKGAHSGMDPEKGASAIVALSHVIQRLHALNDPDRGLAVNVGVIEGGQRANVVAPESRAEADLRVRTAEDARWLEDRIRSLEAEIPGTEVEVEGGVTRPPMERTPGNVALWEAARREGEKLGIALDHAMSGGASDGNFTSQHTPTLDGLGAVGDGAHAEHEFVFVDSLAERASLLALLLMLPPMARDPK